MNLADRIGKRGENIFRVLITRWCDGHPWFDEIFLGDKQETIDFMVKLIDASTGGACFCVQVKATKTGYSGSGSNRKLKVKVSREDVKKLKQTKLPTYVVGIDIDKERGYVMAITQSSEDQISGIPTRKPLNCKTIKTLWKEVDDYWKTRPMLPEKSQF
jgi:hypothetical protein